MKRYSFRPPILAALVLAIAVPALPAQEPAGEEAADAEVPAWQMDYENLAPEERKRYNDFLFRATTLFNQKRIFEALNAAYDAEAIFDKNPAALNLKGACYVEFRSFEVARDLFNQALELSPGSSNVLFNIAEMDFVTGQWEDCARRMAELLTKLKPEETAMSRLVEFKLLLAMTKTGKIDAARELADKYDFIDDTPFHYYANAALEYHDGNTADAERWLGSARRVFRTPDALAPWQDTLIEFGYIKSFYGGDLGTDLP